MTRSWIIALIIIAIFLLAGAGGGGYYAWQLYQENLALKVEKQELQKLVDATNNNLATTTNLLQAEVAKNEAIASQVSSIASTVGNLDKLSKIDKELLIKYSKISFLNEHYVPVSLTTITPAFVSSDEEQSISSSVWPFLERLLVSATSSGIDLRINSAYRSYGTQAKIKTGFNFVYGEGTANNFSADQGYSEHQLGTTVDFSTPNSGGDFKFGETEAFAWLTNNAYKYGFILSYPEGNGYYQYEPWHWRFVGVELATKMRNENKRFYEYPQRTLDTFLANIFD
jgi:LAS superfamily LD-carboxypeptidase LdcB